MKKIKQYLIAILCLSMLCLSGCDDNMSLVGNILVPEDDIITAYSDTFQIKASTIQRDSLFAKKTTGLLGEYVDPLYGRLKSDFLCQFYCEEGFQFYKTPYENEIDSVCLALYYYEIGDPNTPFQFQVYPVTKPLDRVYYTNVNAGDYCDLNNIWGTGVYTAYNGVVIDTTRVLRKIEIQLPIEVGKKIYEETVNNPASFKTQQAFNDFFPGIYVTTGYGSGCMFDIRGLDIFIKYRYLDVDTAGVESILYTFEQFTTTKEVIQLNRFENSDTEQLLAENKDYTFIKTPAGIYTRLVFPFQEIKSVIEDRIINRAMFSVKYMPNEDWPYALAPPPHLLLLPEDSLTSFFQNRFVDNNITSYVSTTSNNSSSTTDEGYSSSNRAYYFNNISALLSYHLRVSPDEDLRLLLVPVSRNTSQDANNSYYSAEISNFLAASGLKIRKDNDLMNLTIITSKYNQ